MAFLTPAIIAGISTAATTTVSLVQMTQANTEKKRRRSEVLAAEGDELRKAHLLAERTDRTRQRRSSGSGQGTILSGESGTQAEIGRNVLLGQ